MERLVKILFFSIIALLPLLMAFAMFSISRQKPLPSWARNWFFKLVGAPEILDRIVWVLIGLFFVSMAVMLVLVGALK